jgi:hypothetical protein
MTPKVELGQSINESFRAVLVLTGSVEVAERAVTHAIDDVGPDDVRNALILQVPQGQSAENRKDIELLYDNLLEPIDLDFDPVSEVLEVFAAEDHA